MPKLPLRERTVSFGNKEDNLEISDEESAQENDFKKFNMGLKLLSIDVKNIVAQK